ASDAGQHQVLDDQRGAGGGVALLVIGQRRFPERAPRFDIQRDQLPLDIHAEEFVAVDRESAIHRTAAETDFGRRTLPDMPDRPPGDRIHGPGMIRRSGDEHEAIEHERGRLDAARHAGLENPAGRQPRDTARVDLGGLAVPPQERILAVRAPRARIALGTDAGDERPGEQPCRTGAFHCASPCRLRRYARLRSAPTRVRLGPRLLPRVPTRWHRPQPPFPQKSDSPAAASPADGAASCAASERTYETTCHSSSGSKLSLKPGISAPGTPLAITRYRSA